MKKRWFLVVGLGLLFIPLVMSQPLQDQAPPEKPQGKVLKVTISYEGKGKVDNDHGIHLFLFDSPDFVQNPGAVMPIGFQATNTNGGTVTFRATAENVYLVAIFDDKGGYTPSSGAPPSGTPVAVYKPGDPAMPTPIKLEASKDVEIRFIFDDSMLMP